MTDGAPVPPQQHPAPGYAPHTPAPKGKKKWPWIVGGIVALIVVGSVANAGKDDPAPAAGGQPSIAAPAAPVQPAAPAAPAAPAKSTVVYKVTGTAKDATIMFTSYNSGSWSTSNLDGVALPWEKTIEVDSTFLSGGSLTVVTGMKGGDITCSVQVDGKEAKTGTASGKFSSASCTGF